jgi:hypothetical protein
VATVLVDQTRGSRLSLRPHPAITPTSHRNDNGVEFQTFVGESVLIPHRPLLICDRFDDSEFPEVLKQVGESTGRDAGVGLQHFKTARHEEEFPKKKQGPAFSHDPDGAGNRAGEVFNFSFAHERSCQAALVTVESKVTKSTEEDLYARHHSETL